MLRPVAVIIPALCLGHAAYAQSFEATLSELKATFETSEPFSSDQFLISEARFDAAQTSNGCDITISFDYSDGVEPVNFTRQFAVPSYALDPNAIDFIEDDMNVETSLILETVDFEWTATALTIVPAEHPEIESLRDREGPSNSRGGITCDDDACIETETTPLVFIAIPPSANDAQIAAAPDRLRRLITHCGGAASAPQVPSEEVTGLATPAFDFEQARQDIEDLLTWSAETPLLGGTISSIHADIDESCRLHVQQILGPGFPHTQTSTGTMGNLAGLDPNKLVFSNYGEGLMVLDVYMREDADWWTSGSIFMASNPSFEQIPRAIENGQFDGVCTAEACVVMSSFPYFNVAFAPGSTEGQEADIISLFTDMSTYCQSRIEE